MRKNVTQKLVVTALLVAITVVLKCTASIMLPFAGAGGMRISLSTFFSKLPALLFGAAAGVMSSFLCDVIPAFVRPDGAYIPLLTVTACLGGFLCGFLYKKTDKLNTVNCKKYFTFFVAIIGTAGVLNCICASFFPDCAYTVFMRSMGEKRCWFVTSGFVAAFVAGAAVLVFDTAVKRRNAAFGNGFLKLFSVLLISNITVTTLNTFILRVFVPSLKSLAFFVFYIPRLIEEIIATAIQAYASAYLLYIANKSGIVKKKI